MDWNIFSTSDEEEDNGNEEENSENEEENPTDEDSVNNDNTVSTEDFNKIKTVIDDLDRDIEDISSAVEEIQSNNNEMSEKIENLEDRTTELSSEMYQMDELRNSPLTEGGVNNKSDEVDNNSSDEPLDNQVDDQFSEEQQEQLHIYQSNNCFNSSMESDSIEELAYLIKQYDDDNVVERLYNEDFISNELKYKLKDYVDKEKVRVTDVKDLDGSEYERIVAYLETEVN